jgi:hypothetical protein
MSPRAHRSGSRPPPTMRFLVLLISWLLCGAPAFAGDASLTAEIEALKRQVAEQAARLEELSRRLAETKGEAAESAVVNRTSQEGEEQAATEGSTPTEPWLAAGPVEPAGASLRGYAVASYERVQGEPDTFNQEKFAVYFNSPLNDQVSVFAEIEFAEGVRLTEPDTGDDRDVDNVKVERALVDYHPSDWAQVRVGKFLTPFGDWNVNHADPLHYTTSRPLVVRFVFPETLTGILFRGTAFPGDWEVDYRLHVANGRGERPDTRDANWRKAIGGRVAVRPRGDLQLGASFLDDSDDRYDDWHQQNFGIDFRWRPGALDLNGEAIVSRSEGAESQGSPEGYFLEAAYTFGQRLTPVLRYEWLRRPYYGRAMRVGVLGIAYRPLPPLLLKAEYQARRGGPTPWRDDAFLASVATFF